MWRSSYSVVVCCSFIVLALTVVTSSASRGGHGGHRNAGPSVVRAAGQREGRPSVKYENFDEYLLSIGAAESRRNVQNQVNKNSSPPGRRVVPAQATDDEDLIGGSGNTEEGEDGDEQTQGSPVTPTPQSPEERRPEPPSPAWDLDILGYFRDVPRQHWSCCMLGKLAGDKGFHCYAGFYAARIQTRNLNRAHNKKMHFHGHDAIPHWGTNIMHTFERCVATHGDEFHKCCYAATIEKRERQKWSRYANQGEQETQGEEQTEQLQQREEQQRQAQQQSRSHRRQQLGHLRSSSVNRPAHHQTHH